jgi:hypothetical protein
VLRFAAQRFLRAHPKHQYRFGVARRQARQPLGDAFRAFGDERIPARGEARLAREAGAAAASAARRSRRAAKATS